MVAVLAVAASTPSYAHAGAAAAATAACQPGPRRLYIVGWLKPCGTALVDEQGHRVRLLSVNMTGMIRGAGNREDQPCGRWQPRAPELFDAAKAQGFNAVYLAISWANIEPQRPIRDANGRLVHRWNDLYLEAIDAAVDEARARGLAVILMMVQSRWSPAFKNLVMPGGGVEECGIGMPPWLYPRGGGIAKMVKAELAFFRNRHGQQRRFIAAWRMVARRYVEDRSVVGALLLSEAYDLLGQPYPGTEGLRPADLKLAGFYERVGAAVHRANPHLLLIYWDSVGHGRKARFSITRRPAVPKRVYGFEFYASRWYPQGLRRLRRFVQRGHGWGHPVSIGEFTAFNYTRRESGLDYPSTWRAQTNSVVRWAKRHGVGWNISGEVDEKLAVILRQWR
jgi:hypothetical protein